MKTYYIGSYTNQTPHRGIYQMQVSDTDSTISLLLEIDNPTFLAVCDHTLVAGTWNEKECGIVIYDSISNHSTTLLRPTIARGACHVAISSDAKYASTSYFHEGSFEIYDLERKERMGYYVVPVDQGEVSRIHHTEFVGDHLLVVDYGLDRIQWFDTKTLLCKQTLDLEKGSGPRQLVSYKNQYYLLCENKPIIYEIEYEDTLKIKAMHCIDSDLPWSGSAVRIQNDHLLFCSRGQEKIFVYNIEEGQFKPISIIETHGKEPRDFCIDLDTLYITNQEDNHITIIALDSGYQSVGLQHLNVYKPSCIVKTNDTKNKS